jgi:hypothetical protein
VAIFPVAAKESASAAPNDHHHRKRVTLRALSVNDHRPTADDEAE